MSAILATYLGRTRASRALYERSCRVVPGGIHHPYRFYRPYPVYLKRGWGSHIEDVDGNEYVDLWSAHYAAILGHAPAVVLEGLEGVIEGGSHFGIPSENEVRFAELLAEVLPGVEAVRFGVSGTEVTMYAVRLARAFTGRKVILKVTGGWHGPSSDLCVAIAPPFGTSDSAGLSSDLDRTTVAIPFNDRDGTVEVLDRVGDDLAGVIVEPVLGAGFLPASAEYLRFLRAETEARGSILIFDEVICGFRLALGGAREYYGVTPDLSTYGKIAGGGFNLGFIGGRRDLLALADSVSGAAKGQRVLIGGGTYSCTPLSMVGGRVLVEYLRANEAEVYSSLSRLGERARTGIETAVTDSGLAVQVDGVGSLLSAVITNGEGPRACDAAALAQRSDAAANQLFLLGLFNEGVHHNRARGALSMAHTDEDVDAVIEAAARAAAAVVREL